MLFPMKTHIFSSLEAIELAKLTETTYFSVLIAWALDEMQGKFQQMQQEELHPQEEVKKLKDERQEFITKARKERMPDEKFSPKISALYPAG